MNLPVGKQVIYTRRTTIMVRIYGTYTFATLSPVHKYAGHSKFTVKTIDSDVAVIAMCFLF